MRGTASIDSRETAAIVGSIMTVRTIDAVKMSYPPEVDVGKGNRPPVRELSPGSTVALMIGTRTKKAQNP